MKQKIKDALIIVGWVFMAIMPGQMLPTKQVPHPSATASMQGPYASQLDCEEAVVKALKAGAVVEDWGCIQTGVMSRFGLTTSIPHEHLENE